MKRKQRHSIVERSPQMFAALCFAVAALLLGVIATIDPGGRIKDVDIVKASNKQSARPVNISETAIPECVSSRTGERDEVATTKK